MSRRSTKIVKAALSALHYTGVGDFIAPITGGTGVIFMLHRVSPDKPRAFEPNRILMVTPTFLERVITDVRAAGFDIVPMDDVPERLKNGDATRPFAVFTLDDGYRDNLVNAYEVFKRQQAPFTIYVPTDYADGRGDLWWLTLEEAIARLSAIALNMGGIDRTFSLVTPDQKDAAFHQIYWWLRSLPEDRARAITHRLAAQAQFDPFKFCRQLVMTWDEVKTLARDPVVTIGAHTIGHYALAKLSVSEVQREIADSMARLSNELGKPCRHFSYPYGCESSAGEREFEIARDAGVLTAVTTRKGLLHARHKSELTALPRLSLNGDYQDMRYVKALLSGAPFALLNAAQRMIPTRTKDAAQS